MPEQPERPPTRRGSADGAPSTLGRNTTVGKGEYVVQPGDCLSSIAYSSGHFWETIWNDPVNAELKAKRRDPHLLLPGDRVEIPPLWTKEVAAATEKRHKFRLKGVPSVLRLQLMHEPERRWEIDDDGQLVQPEESREDKPCANTRYILNVEGSCHEGMTDSEGRIQVKVSPAAKWATLILEPGTPKEEHIPLLIGALCPSNEMAGVKQRLANLGFECGERGADVTPAFEAALRGFQHKHGLEATGVADKTIVDQLIKLEGN